MRIADGLLPEFDREMDATRRTLERIPAQRLDWRPHEKSFAMGALGAHIANLPNWAVMTVEQDRFDMSGPAPKTEVPESVEDILALFDSSVAAARAAIAGAGDETLLAPWSLVNGGETAFTMPRIAVLRSFVMNHLIHHRAQLAVYLRLNDIPVPALYGPSADESPM